MSEELKEVWLPAEGYPGYEVSNLGRFRSFRTSGGVKETPRLKSVVFNNGKMKVNVRIGGKSTLVLFARIVAKAFLGEPEGRLVVYRNEDPHDCRVENLEYVTRDELWHRIRFQRYLYAGDESTMGRQIKADRKHRTQLDRALEVKKLREKGFTFKQIGDELDLSESGAYRIYAGANNHVLEKALSQE